MRPLTLILSGSDDRAVDAAARRVLDALDSSDNAYRGPIPLPPKAPARVQRRIDVPTPNHKMTAAIEFLTLPTTVTVDVR